MPASRRSERQHYAGLDQVILDGLPLTVRSAGVATYTLELALALGRAAPDTQFSLLCPRIPGATSAPELPNDAPANVRLVRSVRYPAIMGEPIRFLGGWVTLESAVGRADLFHGTTFSVPRRCSTPLVVTIHDLALLRFPELGTPALRRMVSRCRQAARAARLIVAVSEATRRDVIDLLGVPQDRVRVVHNGISESFRPVPAGPAAARAREITGAEGPYILHVGTLEPRKNLSALIHSFAAIRRRRSVPHRLVLAGARGWNCQPLFGLVERLGLGELVVFPGYVPPSDLVALYSAADLFVYPSRYEGFGFPPLEAMGCGAPVITSDSSSLPEVTGDAALHVDPNDNDALTAAMLRVLSDDSLREELRHKGQQRARHFSWDRCARQTLTVYREALAARPQ
jgi:glycosyltransferase involved in cell wall biosynthesis